METFVLAQNAKFKRKLYGILFNVANPEEMTGYLSKLKKEMKASPQRVEEALKTFKISKHHITRETQRIKKDYGEHNKERRVPVTYKVPAKAKKFDFAAAKALIEPPKPAPKPAPKPKAAPKTKPDLLVELERKQPSTDPLFKDMTDKEILYTRAEQEYYVFVSDRDNYDFLYGEDRNGDMFERKGAHTKVTNQIAEDLGLPKNWRKLADDITEKYHIQFDDWKQALIRKERLAKKK